MTTYNPIHALLLFIAISLLVFLFFRPNKGWFWGLKNTAKTKKKEIVEDILKLLYHSENAGKYLNTDEVVRTIKENDGSVIECIAKMASVEMITMEGNAIRLTESGTDYALHIVRAHRLWERFLADKTGFAKAEWHGLAERKEHKLSVTETDLFGVPTGESPIRSPWRSHSLQFW